MEKIRSVTYSATQENEVSKITALLRLLLRALSFCQNWQARPTRLQRKSNNLKKHLHDNPSHSPQEGYIILEVCSFESVVE